MMTKPERTPNKTTPLREQMRRELKRLNYKASTIEQYINWCIEFAAYHKKSPEQIGEVEIRDWLSHLANDKNVAWSTQHQAMCAVVCLYREVLRRDLGDFGQFSLASKLKRLPVVVSRPRVFEIISEVIGGENQLVCKNLYGSCMRINEGLHLRIHDIDFDRKTVFVRAPKNDHDRLVMLPDKLIPELHVHIERVKRQHAKDLADGFGRVALPDALERKYKNADIEPGWQWVFPAKNFSIDPKDGKRKRWHIDDNTIQKAVKKAVMKCGIDQHFTPHCFRHCFGTHLYESGVDILKIKELMGHKDIATTMIYVHLARKPSETIQSPYDQHDAGIIH